MKSLAIVALTASTTLAGQIQVPVTVVNQTKLGEEQARWAQWGATHEYKAEVDRNATAVDLAKAFAQF